MCAKRLAPSSPISMRLETSSWSATTIHTWNAHPSAITNAAAVLANGDPPDYRARLDFVRPAAHVNNAAAAVLSLYKQELDAHVAYTVEKPHSLQPYWPVLARTMKPTWRQLCTPFQSTPCLPARLSTPCSYNTARLLGQTCKSLGIRSLSFYRLWLSLRPT